jgi:tRNA (uracil-5-)-methyltransferase TRM9
MQEYDEIAESWYRTRHYTRFKLELDELAGRWKSGKLLNIGAAHGPDFLPFREDFDLCGLDISEPMVRFAGKYARKFEFDPALMVANASSLPFKDSSIDWAISIAAIHSIPTAEGRNRALQEIGRVLRPGGEVFLTVWNRWQPRFWLRGKDVTLPWDLKGKTIIRRYHLFSAPELAEAVRGAGLEVRAVLPERTHQGPIDGFSKNICVLARKIMAEDSRESDRVLRVSAKQSA